MMDEHKTIRLLSPAEAYGIIYLKEAPEMKKLPPLSTPKLSQ
jgi:hypothetical protein